MFLCIWSKCSVRFKILALIFLWDLWWFVTLVYTEYKFQKCEIHLKFCLQNTFSGCSSICKNTYIGVNWVESIVGDDVSDENDVSTDSGELIGRLPTKEEGLCTELSGETWIIWVLGLELGDGSVCCCIACFNFWNEETTSIVTPVNILRF